MSGNFSYSATSSTSFSSSSTRNGETTGSRYASQSQSTPAGTTVRTASQNTGEPVYTEERTYDSSGRPMVQGGSTGSGGNMIEQGRIQEITDEDEAARKYEKRMEDEYAKREGGA